MTLDDLQYMNDGDVLRLALLELRAIRELLTPSDDDVAIEPPACTHRDEAIRFTGRNGAPSWTCDDCNLDVTEAHLERLQQGV